jgi:hypothetical protein
MRSTRCIVRSAALVGALMAGSAAAAERDPLEARFILDAGAFLVSTDTRVRLDGTLAVGRRGTDINFERTFGIGDADRFRLDAFWRIRSRHALRGAFFQNNRTGSRTLERDISFGDQTFPLSAQVSARSDTTIAQLTYEYAFLRRKRFEVAGSLGVYYADLEFDLTGSAWQELRRQNASTHAPLPLFGVRGLWRLTDALYVSGQAQYFDVNVDPYSGSLIDLKAALVWQVTDHLGLGVAYDDFDFRFDIDDEGDFNGRLRWEYGGLMAFASLMF